MKKQILKPLGISLAALGMLVVIAYAGLLVVPVGLALSATLSKSM